MDELLRDFLAESAEQLEAIGVRLTSVELDSADPGTISSVYRLIHAIKAACGFLNLPRLENVAHAAEDLTAWMSDDSSPKGTAISLMLEAIDRMRFILAGLAEGHVARFEAATTGPSASRSSYRGDSVVLETPISAPSTPPERRADTIRVSSRSIERMTALVSDLVVTRNQLFGAAANAAVDPIRIPLQRLAKITAELQSGVLAIRMQPIDRLFDNLQRFARGISADLGKRVELSLEGGETLLDRQQTAAIRESLAKLIRDAVEFGIEPPGDRLRSGKPDVGLIKISARQDADQAVIEVSDDGRGLDAGFLRELASRPDSGPDSSASRCCGANSERRGGLDGVRASIEEIGGSVALASQVGEGATITLRVPLTVGVVPALIVVAGPDRFALPQRAIEELVEIDSSSDAFLEDTQSGLVLKASGEVTPAARLSLMMRSVANIDAPLASAPLGLLMRAGGRRFAIVVDAVADVQEIAVKPLPRQLRHMALFSESAILGDGSAALLLNPDGLAKALGLTNEADRRRNDESTISPIALVLEQGVRHVAPLADEIADTKGTQNQCRFCQPLAEGGWRRHGRRRVDRDSGRL